VRIFVPLVFLLCIGTSMICVGLLFRGWRRTGTRLLLWSAVCFVCLAINNLLVFIDAIVLPNMDLRPLRLAASLAAVTVLLWGLIWETE
jgi:hypothetical protein